MHRMFRKELDDATGVSEFVIALVADIRGFSVFSQTVESTDLAMYIKRVYIKMIDDYFTDASFYKPTGDGLLVIIPFTEKSLAEIANKTLETCLRLVSEFPNLCDNDPMINYDVPTQLGIGLTRGSASRLEHGNLVLDYSGRVLNLASRLNDLARPGGVVYDESFDQGIVRNDLKDLFSKENVYIRSVAERKTVSISFTSELTEITDRSRTPFGDTPWEVQSITMPRRKWEKIGLKYGIDLKHQPCDPSSIKVQIVHPAVDKQGRQMKEMLRRRTFKDWDYGEDAGKGFVTVNVESLLKYLDRYTVKTTWDVQLKITYEKKC